MEQQSAKKPTRISEELKLALGQAFDSFLASSRYPMFETLRVGEFTRSKSSPFQEYSFVDLIDLGSEKAVSIPKAKPQHITELIQVITSLIGEEPTPAVIPFPSQTHKRRENTGPVLNSIEAEERLSEAIENLRFHPRLEELSSKTIGEYWQKDWIRAPFEEALTFKQLSQLKPSSLLEKRSFSAQKLLHILDAVTIALSHTSSDYRTKPPVQEKVTTPIITAPTTREEYFELARALCIKYKELAQNCNDPLKAMFIGQTFSPPPNQARSIVLLSKEELSRLATSLDSDITIVEGIQEIARQQLKNAKDWNR